MAMTLQELAQRIGATIDGDGSTIVTGCAPIDSAGTDQITFFANIKYRRFLEDTNAAAVLVDDATKCPEGVTRLVCDDPYFGFRNAMIELHGHRRHPPPIDGDECAISAHAVIHPDAVVGAGTIIHPHVTVEAGATLGTGCVLYPGVYVGTDATIGDDCLLFPNVVIYDHCMLGNRVTLHANTAIGCDGFGYATHEGVHHKIPQCGIVIIDDDVELGAGCAIERGAIGETRIGAGTKFADLISIGHGTTIGKHCLFVSLCGVAGSVEVGDYVVLGGQTGVAGHLRIGHGVQAMAHSGIVGDIPDGQKVGGEPAIPYTTAKKNYIAATELYELFKRVRKLEKELDDIKSTHES